MKISWAPSESNGTSTTSSADGPNSAPDRHQHEDLRDADQAGDEARQERAHEEQAEREEDVVGHLAHAVALDRQPRDVRCRDEQQHDHERRAQRHRDQAAARVLACVVERLLGGLAPRAS